MVTALLGLRYFHIACAASAFLIGPFAMRAPKRRGWHTQIGLTYYWLMTSACVTALVLAVLNWEKSAGLAFLSVFSYVFLFNGKRAEKLRTPGWLDRHVRGMLGSYIALVTAVVVVGARHIPFLAALPSWLLWMGPTLIGSPLIAYVRVKIQQKPT